MKMQKIAVSFGKFIGGLIVGSCIAAACVFLAVVVIGGAGWLVLVIINALKHQIAAL